MRNMTDRVLRLADVPKHGVSVDELIPLEKCPMEQTVFCIHCYSLYPFGDSVVCSDGLIYCPVVDCEGSLIDQVPVVETQAEEDAGKGWYREGLSGHLGDGVRTATLAEMVWSGVWTAMTREDVHDALEEAWA